MMKFNKKKIFKLNKLNLLIILFLILIGILPFTFSKFESENVSDIVVSQAIFLLHDEEETLTVKLPEIIPSNNQYYFRFSISNNDGEKRTDTSLEYDLKIMTTTNIPIQYDLFKSLDINGATSIITSNNIISDDDGTFFRVIETNKENFGISEDQTNNYTLVMNFPSSYNSFNYQDLFEMIEIQISARQVLSSDN